MTSEDNFSITPDMIDLRMRLLNTFGSVEREELAEQLIRFAQHRGGWVRFRRSEIRDFLGDDFFFLDEAEMMDFVVNNNDGTYEVTEYLIRSSHESHPKVPATPGAAQCNASEA